ncbi:MAG: molybdopterin molybdotransferase MoeA [Thermoleophilia bacterium]|nr:molybdopterin molybdotransferase MoeA [Thermoleophilia bacterium]
MAIKLISIDDARARVLGEAFPLPVERLPLAEVLGRVLGEEIVASHSVPPFDNAGMDGFAVRAADIVDATADTPVWLQVLETIPAGHVGTQTLRPEQAAKIMTGAPIPEGADVVVQSEVTEEVDGRVSVLEPAKRGKNIRRAGEDVAAGDRVLGPGSALGPAEIGLIASLGYPTVQVYQCPRVAILSTGSELVEVDRPLGPGQIRNSNSYSLRALCQQMGIEPTMLGIVPDDYEATKELVRKGLDYDVLLTTGGVSVGQFDFIKDIQDDLGVQRKLWGVAMKPGKPLAFGVRDRTLVFGLPGNPVSAMVSFELFVRPTLLRLMGHPKTTRPLYQAVMSEDASNSDGRVYVVRVRAWREDDTWHVSATGAQGSGILRSMVGANGLVFIPGGPRGVKAGERVDFLLMREDLQEP